MWTYEDKEVTDSDVEGYVGFTYIIHNIQTNRDYIGKKLLKFSKTKQVKGKKKKFLVESDWKDYYGSSEELKADVVLFGKENFQRTILRFCKTKAECNYFELYEQIVRNVLLSDSYYNSYVGTRVHKSHLKHLRPST